MPAKFTIKVRDWDGETSTAQFAGVTLSAGNFAAQTALQDALEVALGGLIIGEVANRQRVAEEVMVSADKPASQYAQRETKWLVQYSDTTLNKLHTMEIPCAKLDLLTGNSKELDLTGTEGAAFKTAFEAYVKSPAGNAVTVQKITNVGRNL